MQCQNGTTHGRSKEQPLNSACKCCKRRTIDPSPIAANSGKCPDCYDCRCVCKNEARYICVDGTERCGICAMGIKSVRRSDVPAMLKRNQQMEEAIRHARPWFRPLQEEELGSEKMERGGTHAQIYAAFEAIIGPEEMIDIDPQKPKAATRSQTLTAEAQAKLDAMVEEYKGPMCPRTGCFGFLGIMQEPQVGYICRRCRTTFELVVTDKNVEMRSSRQ